MATKRVPGDSTDVDQHSLNPAVVNQPSNETPNEAGPTAEANADRKIRTGKLPKWYQELQKGDDKPADLYEGETEKEFRARTAADTTADEPDLEDPADQLRDGTPDLLPGHLHSSGEPIPPDQITAITPGGTGIMDPVPTDFRAHAAFAQPAEEQAEAVAVENAALTIRGSDVRPLRVKRPKGASGDTLAVFHVGREIPENVNLDELSAHTADRANGIFYVSPVDAEGDVLSITPHRATSEWVGSEPLRISLVNRGKVVGTTGVVKFL